MLMNFLMVLIDKNTADKLAQLAIILNDGWKVTEACVSIINTNQCKTTIDHLDECHLNGTCVDIGYGGDPGEAKRNNFKKKANQVGLNVLDEYLCPQYGSGFHVVPASQYACPSNNYCWSCWRLNINILLNIKMPHIDYSSLGFNHYPSFFALANTFTFYFSHQTNG